ncbi:MAG: hypothetical protein K2Q09_05165, partial [Phycisphaerales bacterium]|nr:hypothetical protein [Phycisphaerales bacterium]
MVRSRLFSVFAVVLTGPAGRAEPVYSPWPMPAGGGPAAVAAAPLGGLWATSDGVTVEVRDVRGAVRLSRGVADLSALVPGMNAASARVARVCLSDSGRLLFVLLTRPEASQPGVGRWEDVIRIDVETGEVSLFVTLAVTPDRAAALPGPILHVGGRLSYGSGGAVAQFSATRNQLTGGTLGSIPTQSGVDVVALAFDRVGGWLFAVDANGVLFRMSPTAAPSTPLGNVGVGVVSAAFSEHYGGAANAGLYLGYADGRVRFVSAAAARGSPPVVAGDYASGAGAQSVAAGCDGSLLVGDSLGARRVLDTADTRLGFDAWL